MERNCNSILRLKATRPEYNSITIRRNQKKMPGILIIKANGQYICTAYWIIRVRSAIRKYRKRDSAFETLPFSPESARRRRKAFGAVKRLYKKRPDDPRVEHGVLPEEKLEEFYQWHEGLLKIRDVYLNYKGEVLVLPF
jgi:hypothetical protein